MENNEKRPYEEVMGINLDVSSVIAGEIVKKFFASISEEQMKQIVDSISEDILGKDYDGNMIVKFSKETYAYYGNQRKITLGDEIKKSFDAKVKEDLLNECLKIIETKDYKDKVHKWAEEIVDYINEGYKDEIRNNLYHKLVGQAIDTTGAIQYNGATLRNIIQEEISKALHSSR